MTPAATNGVAHYAQGDFRGPESLRKFYLQELGRGQLGLAEGRIYPHIMIQPVVTVAEDGKTAKGRWHVSLDNSAQKQVLTDVHI